MMKSTSLNCVKEITIPFSEHKQNFLDVILLLVRSYRCSTYSVPATDGIASSLLHSKYLTLVKSYSN